MWNQNHNVILSFYTYNLPLVVHCNFSPATYDVGIIYVLNCTQQCFCVVEHIPYRDDMTFMWRWPSNWKLSVSYFHTCNQENIFVAEFYDYSTVDRSLCNLFVNFYASSFLPSLYRKPNSERWETLSTERLKWTMNNAIVNIFNSFI